jgi:ribosomal protein S12 methylthiotransferase accessory factor
MSGTTSVEIELAGRRSVSASVNGHLIWTDQPLENGGDDSAPSPFDLFAASIGACAGVFVQGFCAKRGIPYEGIRLHEQLRYAPDGALAEVSLEIRLPETFPAKYRDAVVKVAEQCSVKRAILAEPAFTVTAVAGNSSDSLGAAAP